MSASDATQAKGIRYGDLRRIGDALTSERVCEAVFRVACVAWLVYRTLHTSYYWPILDEWGGVSIDFFYHRLPLVVAYIELAKVLRGEYRLRDVASLAIAWAMTLYAERRQIHADACMLMLLLCARNFDPRRTLRFFAWVLAGALAFVLASAAAGAIADIILYQRTRVRHCMGFTYALFPSQYLFCLTCVACALRGRRLSLAEGALLLAANVLMYVLTDSRLSFGLAALLVVTTLLLGRWRILDNRADWLWKVLSWSFVVVLVASLAGPLLYGAMSNANADVAHLMDRAIGARLRQANQAFSEYGMSAFGQYVPFMGNGLNQYGQIVRTTKYFYVDILFARALVERGWVYVLCLAGLWTRLARSAYRQGDKALLLALAATAAHFLIDDLSLELHYNLLLLLLGGYGAASQTSMAERSHGSERASSRPGVAPRSRMGWAVAGVLGASCGLLALFLAGIVGSEPTSLAKLVGARSMVRADDEVIFSLSCAEDGTAHIEHHGNRIEGTISLQRSNHDSASYEVRDAEGTYCLTLVTPLDLSGDGVGMWKVFNPYAKVRRAGLLLESAVEARYGARDNRFATTRTIPAVEDKTATAQLSDFFELREDGTALWRTGSYNVLEESNESLERFSAAGTWRLDGANGTTVHVDATSLAVLPPPRPTAIVADAEQGGEEAKASEASGISYQNDAFGVSLALPAEFWAEDAQAANEGEIMDFCARDATGNRAEVFLRNMDAEPLLEDAQSWASAFAEAMRVVLLARGDVLAEPIEAKGDTVSFVIEADGMRSVCAYQFDVRDGVGICVGTATVEAVTGAG